MARKIDPSKRTAILTAARMVLLRDGYTAAKMSDIAQEAGVAPGTLYLYFDSKEALATAIGEAFFSRLTSEFAEVVKKLDHPEGVDIMLDWAAQIASEEKELFKLLRQSHHSDDCRNDENSPKRIFRAHLAQALEDLMKKKGNRQYDASPLADVVMAVLGAVFMSSIFGASVESTKLTASQVLKHALFEDTTLAEKPLKGNGQKTSSQPTSVSAALAANTP